MNLTLAVGVLPAARPLVRKGESWLETHVALVPVAVQLPNGFYKASSFVQVHEGAQRNNPQLEGTCKGKGKDEWRISCSLPALLLGFHVLAHVELCLQHQR